VKPARASMLHDTIVSVLNENAAAVARAAAAAETTPAAKPSGHALRVLVAEDNVVNQMVIAAMLEALGCEIRMASDGVEAVKAFESFRPDVVLMDISMPDMDGAEACRRIRDIERAKGGRTPIIGVTAHAMKEDRQRCLDAGMDDHLPKPVKADLLRDALARWTPAFAKSA
ncbi:MAG: response regulator, partial [Parvularculaceae bacterium]|nr:response regulator [Parvularculaceae bacterium]